MFPPRINSTDSLAVFKFAQNLHLLLENILPPAARKDIGIGAEQDPIWPKDLQGLVEDGLQVEMRGHIGQPGVRARGIDIDVRSLGAEHEDLTEIPTAEMGNDEVHAGEFDGCLVQVDGIGVAQVKDVRQTKFIADADFQDAKMHKDGMRQLGCCLIERVQALIVGVEMVHGGEQRDPFESLALHALARERRRRWAASDRA